MVQSRAPNRQALMEIAQLIVEHSRGKARLALQEEDKSTEGPVDSAHFIKVDEHRLGRDIELYGLLVEMQGWEATLPMILEELLLPIKGRLPRSYQEASERLRLLGHQVYPSEMLADWDNLFQ